MRTALAILLLVPFALYGNVSGHDFEFHLASWMDVMHQWHQRVLYPRWAELANWGYGEPRFVDGDALLPGSNLSALLRLFSWGELLRGMPSAFRASKDGQTVYSYYSRIVGRKNYGEVLGPMLAAVPSQSADAFPAAMLFKSRASRRKDFPRSFTISGGLQAIPEAIGLGIRRRRSSLGTASGAHGSAMASCFTSILRDRANIRFGLPPAETSALFDYRVPDRRAHRHRVGRVQAARPPPRRARR